MADAGHEVAEHQAPLAAATEHRAGLGQVVALDVEPVAVASEDRDAERAADGVAHGDADRGAGHGRGVGRERAEPALADQHAGDEEQGFAGHRQSRDAQDEQHEDRQAAVYANPLEERVFHWKQSIPSGDRDQERAR